MVEATNSMKYPLNAEIIIQPDTKQPVFSWEVVRSETELIGDNNNSNRRYITREELHITIPVNMKTHLFPGRMVSVDNGESWWRVESNPHEVEGGWGWKPGLVIVIASRTQAA